MTYSKKVFISLLTSEIAFFLKNHYFYLFEDSINFLNRKYKIASHFQKFISKSTFRNFFLTQFFSLSLIKFPLVTTFISSFQVFEKMFLYFYFLKNIFIVFNYKNFIFIKILFFYNFLFSEFQSLKFLKQFLIFNFNKIFKIKNLLPSLY
jgi:hypothetical protein